MADREKKTVADDADNDRLRTICYWWQQRLRLVDWAVDIRYAREHEFGPESTSAGDVSWLEEAKMARIRLLDPIDYKPDTYTGYDEERTIVHELLHLHFVPFDIADGPGCMAQEQAINAIAQALVSLMRAAPAGTPGMAKDQPHA